jgi:cytochrome b involved in lipid metabolism
MDAWGVWRGKVYNLTPYLDFHPGGVGELLRAAGKEEEGERLFMEIHPWVSWDAMLEECLVGVLVGDDDGDGGDDGGDDDGKGEVMWDEMD